ncbi:MAG: sugar phosphate isomerase/epimerase [Eubacteriales bacterium]|nr:sugar phosphate isomerase/epimerase [Eubacteriales bacterium]
MQFGMPTLIEMKSTESCAALCHELGLAFVELNMNLPEYQVENLEVVRFREIADKYGIYYTIHLDENLCPCDFNNKVAAAYTETVLQTIEVAKRLSVPILNMHLHSGVWFTLPDKKVFLFDEYEREYLRKLTAFRDACAAVISDADIKICVENCGDFGKSYIRKGIALLLESPAFALTFDIGHNAGADYSDEPIIMEYADRLAHFHIHDASSRSNHLMLGDGDVDLPKYLDLAKAYDCRAVLEVKTVDGLRQSVNWLKKRG